MVYPIKNLIFEGGGILGFSYLGALDYLDEIGLLSQINKVAGSSSGAITACITCFNLPFNEIKTISSTLDYKKIPQQKNIRHRGITDSFKTEFNRLFGDFDSIYRLLNNYGWYSSQYLYDWLKNIIASQFDINKKQPPYTFADFQNNNIHLNNKPFKDLYIVGTDISYKKSVIFSFDTTPDMEVAEAVRISMSVPLFFEAIKIGSQSKNDTNQHIFVDGGLMRNYPINIFDHDGINNETLGIQLNNKIKYKETANIIDYICNLFNSLLKIQEDLYNNDWINKQRSITINTGGISSLDFNIDETDYNFLYNQGYKAASDYFNKQRYF